ncbi:MAG: ABC transporter permease [Acidobacteriota bacterium]|nr:ABC transporter permease [Acidobacteriota bacterium]
MPDWARQVRARLSGLHLSPTREAEIVNELSQHLDDRYQELMAGGASADEAARLALSDFRSGNVLGQYMAPLRQSNSSPSRTPGAPTGRVLSDLWQDLRFAMRSFLRAPRFSIPALIALTLGIGATSAIFSVVRGVMLKRLPYRDPERLVAIWEGRLDRGLARNVIADANFVAWRERQKSFDFLGMVGQSRQNIVINDQPEETRGFRASADSLSAIGTQPQLGRLHTPEEDFEGNDRVILISHEFWQTRLGGRTDVLGLSLISNNRPRSVIGVMPPGFTIEGLPTNYLIPYGWTVERLRQAVGRGSSHAMARLRDGVSFEQALDDMQTIMAQLRAEAPQRNTNWSVSLVPIYEQTVEQIRPALYVLSGAVLLVLLIACVNVANLLLARSTVRQRELSLRTALGATRGRLLRQMITESVLLSMTGGAAGLLLAVLFHRGLIRLVTGNVPVPRLDQVALDTPVVLFTLLLSLVTGLIFGVVPAVFATGAANDALREGGRHGSGPRAKRVLSTLVVAEIALSLVLLAGAGLLIRSFIALQNVDTGMRTDGVLTARVTLSGQRYTSERSPGDFFTDVVSRLTAIPGVESASAVSVLPMAGPGIGTSFYRLDRPVPEPGQAPGAAVKPVAPDFFKTMGIAQLAGRDFTASDTLDSPRVAIVSDTLVRQEYPGEDPIGKRLNVAIGRAESGMNVEIAGVVSDIRMVSPADAINPAVYVPHTQLQSGVMTLVIRTSLDPISLTSSVGAAVRAVDSSLPIADVATMDGVVDATLARPRIVSTLLTVFALIALVLAGVGVYGVMAYSVAQRTHEIGVRMALGASTQSVFRLMLGGALRLVIIGVFTGVIAAAWLSRFLTTMLFQTERFDLMTFAATAVVLAIVATCASCVPARRGMKVAPMTALRAE